MRRCWSKGRCCRGSGFRAAVAGWRRDGGRGRWRPWFAGRTAWDAGPDQRRLIGRLFHVRVYRYEGTWKLEAPARLVVPGARCARWNGDDAAVALSKAQGVGASKSTARDLGAIHCAEDEGSQGLRRRKQGTRARRPGTRPVLKAAGAAADGSAIASGEWHGERTATRSARARLPTAKGRAHGFAWQVTGNLP